MACRIGALDVPSVGVGCNSFGTWADEEASLALVDAALDAGARLFDTADYYGGGASEEILGRALQGRRDQAIVATKFGIAGGRPGRGRADAAFVAASAEASLRRLGTDWIDLYQLHFPDPDTPPAETLGALQELVDAGTVREVGVCNVDTEQVDAWVSAGQETGVAVQVVQNEWSLLRRRVEDEVLPTCRRHGLAVLPYFPLASGMLTGKYRRDESPPADTRFAKAPALADRYRTDTAWDVVERLETFAADHGHSLLDLALSWLAGQPEVATVIAGASRPDQVRANVQAATWVLDADECAEVDAITAGRGVTA